MQMCEFSFIVILDQWFSKYSSLANSINDIWELVRNADTGVPAQTHRIRNSGVGPSNLYFNKPSRRF